MRLFLAINPPAELRRDIWSATTPLREIAPSVAWVSEARIHLTLKFFGEHSDTAVAPLSEVIRVVGQNHEPSSVSVGGVGAFPNFRRPGVVWIGVDPDPRLELLHHDVEVACDALGYPLEGRPFRPHLTLGRVNEPLIAEELRALKTAARKVRFTDEFIVGAIDLMQSAIGTAGPVYTSLATAPLGRR